MRIPRIKLDPTRPAGADGPITTVNDVTHWWDGSSLYGSTPDEQRMVRVRRGRASCGSPTDGHLPIPDDPKLDLTMKPGWWTGMGMLLTLFAREHNAVCDRLASEYPNWDDEELFQRARLVVAALHGEDPHRRVDAGGDQPPDDGVRAAGQLVRRRGGADRPQLRPDQRQRGDQRHPGCGDRALRRPVLAHRGVHQRLPDAPAAARRLRPAVGWPPTRPLAQAGFRDAGRAAVQGDRREVRARRPLLLVRDDAPRRDRAAQLPEVPAGVRAAGRQGHRPRVDRHRADPRARRPPVLRVPAADAPEGAGVLRRADRRRERGPRDGRRSTATSRRST